VATAKTAAAPKAKKVDSRRTDFDIPTLQHLAAQRELALIESSPSGECKQVVMFSVMTAPPERVWDVLMDVATYPKFIDTVVSIDVIKKEGTQVMFDWEIDIPFFNLEGRRKQRGKRPQFVEVRGVSFRWRLRSAGAGLVPQSNGQSLPLSRRWNRM
jgi:hypothetical protein